MIRETCSCGAEFETDHPDQVDLVRHWRKYHKHAEKTTSRDSSSLTNTDVAIGFQAIYDPLDDDND